MLDPVGRASGRRSTGHRDARPALRAALPGRFRFRSTGLGVSIAILIFASAVIAQERPAVQVTEEGVLLDFQEADLQVVVAALAELAGLTVVFGPLPSQPVTLRSPRPLGREEVRGLLEGVARANGLTLVDEGGLIRIEPTGPSALDQVQELGQEPVNAAPRAGDPRLFVHPLMHARAANLAETLRSLFGLGGRRGIAGVAEATRSLSEQLGDQAADVDPPLDTQAVAPVDASSQEEERPGQGLAAGLRGPVQVVPDALTNALLIRALPADYETIRAAIEQLDVRPLQVLIEVLIAEVRRDRNFGLGVDIEIPDQEDTETGIVFGGELTGRTAGDVVLRVLRVGAVQADVVLNALASSGDVTILSRPVVLAQNNQQARILVGDERPFIQLFRALPTDAAVRDQVVQYRDVGTELTIRPTINPDGYVTLHLLQEVSTATAETQFGAPIISTREAETRLLVRDGHTAIIGGLVDEQRDDTETGVPILKDIPLFGALFRSTQWRRSTTELFLFLTPHVLRSDQDMDDAARDIREETRHLREELSEPLPLLRPRPDSIRRNGSSRPSRNDVSPMQAVTTTTTSRDDKGDFYGMIGRSLPMRAAFRTIEVLAQAPVPVVILGERGTGKELAARAIHQISGCQRPFVSLNCAEISEPLFESELFGHERGAFTGAIRRRDGLIARASGGILFLDEIGELPRALQAKFLRVLETGEYRPVGADRVSRGSFRLIAATNRNLAKLAARNLFRRDLLDRFGAATIVLPPLRLHLEDVPALACGFLRRYRIVNGDCGPTAIARDAVRLLSSRRWSGNVRQLRNVIEASAAICAGARIGAADVRPFLPTTQRSSTVRSLPTLRAAVRRAEAKAIRHALRRTGGDYDRAATLLGVSVSTLYRKRARLNAGRSHEIGGETAGPSGTEQIARLA